MKRKLSYVLILSLLVTMMSAPTAFAAEEDIIDVFVQQMMDMENKGELVELVRILAFVDGTTTVKDAYVAAFGQFSSPDQERWIHFKRTMDIISNFSTSIILDEAIMLTITDYIGLSNLTPVQKADNAVKLEALIRKNEAGFMDGINQVTKANIIEGFRQLGIVFNVLNDSKVANDLGFSVPIFLTDGGYQVQAINKTNADILIDIANGILGSPTNDAASIVNGLRSFARSYNKLSSEDINVIYGYLNQRGFMGDFTDLEVEEDLGAGEVEFKEEVIPLGLAFQDLGSVPFAALAITRLHAAGVLEGKNTGVFDPSSLVTRAEFAAMMTRMLEMTDEFDESVFTDVTDQDWFLQEVMRAYENGIIEGVGNGKFAPRKNVNKEQAITMMARVLTNRGYEYQSDDTVAAILDFYTDKAAISDWAEESIALTVSLGIEGAPSDNDNILNPKKELTRAEAAVFLFNLAKLVATNVDTVEHDDLSFE